MNGMILITVGLLVLVVLMTGRTYCLVGCWDCLTTGGVTAAPPAK